MADGKPIPIEAKRRAWILSVAHVGNALEHDGMQDIMANWVATGELSEAEWWLLERIAGENRARHGNG